MVRCAAAIACVGATCGDADDDICCDKKADEGAGDTPPPPLQPAGLEAELGLGDFKATAINDQGTHACTNACTHARTATTQRAARRGERRDRRARAQRGDI